MKNRIGLRVPDQYPPREKSFFLHEKELSEWVARLPLGNTGETSRQLFKTLRLFNQTLMPYKRRLSGVEKLREPVSCVASTLRKHYVDVGFPLSEKAHKVSILNRELHSGLATAYKCVVIDILLGNYGRSDQKLLATAIHRAITYLTRVMLLSVLAYDRYSRRIWQELHILHRLAKRYNLENLQVKDQIEIHGKSSTICEAYRRAVLFCLSSPYKIRQRENIQIFDSLLEWAGYTQIHDVDQAPEETTIIIRQDADMPPSHGTPSIDADSRYLLKMDATELIDKLREQFDAQPEIRSLWGLDSLDKSLLRQLIQLWSNEQKRTFVRTKLNFELRTAVGLGNIFRLISDTEEIHSEQQDELSQEDATWIDQKFAEGKVLEISSRFTLEPITAISNREARPADFEDFGPNSRDAYEPEPVTIDWGNSKIRNHPPETHLFHTLNESAGGYCLDWKGSHAPKILVGELIGVQQASRANNQFGVGLVRWLMNNQTDSLQVGLQMIAPNAITVTARHHLRGKTTGHECLLLPEVGTSGQPTSFICPALSFNVGDLVTIDDGQSVREVKLTRLLESSGAITQFQFTYLDNHEEDDPDDEDESDFGRESDFDNLWSTL